MEFRAHEPELREHGTARRRRAHLLFRKELTREALPYSALAGKQYIAVSDGNTLFALSLQQFVRLLK
jgi:hypothetical protein